MVAVAEVDIPRQRGVLQYKRTPHTRFLLAPVVMLMRMAETARHLGQLQTAENAAAQTITVATEVPVAAAIAGTLELEELVALTEAMETTVA